MAAITLVEYAKGSTNTLVQGVIETFATGSPVLGKLAFRTVSGGAIQYLQESSLPGIAFRAINGTYTADSGLILPLIEKTKPMGGEAETDTILVDRFGPARRSQDIMMKVKAAARYFDKVIIDGDETATPLLINGLNKRLTGNQLLYADGVGTIGANLKENALDALIDALDEKPDLLLMGKAIRRQVAYLFRDSSLLSTGEPNYWGVRPMMYDGIEIGIIDKDNDGNVILAMDETVGASTTCGSIYALKFGADRYISGIQSAAPRFKDFGEVADKPCYRFRWEWDCGIAMFHPRCAARLSGITAVSGTV